MEKLEKDEIVNVVHGDMEFGPRALGHTSTLMQPTMKNVEYINHCNGRDTIMPCAPIVTDVSMFKDSEKVIRSLDHMIIALDYRDDYGLKYRGAAHKLPTEDKFTGRPQRITEEHILYPVVDKFKLLVNTSFNIHGQPIVMNHHQIMIAVTYQKSMDKYRRINTVVIP
jgi:carbamoyltransferase